MRFISIRKKFISFATQILLGTLAVSQFTASTLVIMRTHRTFKEVENKIEKSLIDKGKLLVLNNGVALRAMVEEFAFTSIRELVSSTIQKDRDVVYGIFLDYQRRPWVIANSEFPEGLMTEIAVAEDSMSLWADTVAVASYKVCRNNGIDVLEFAAPVIASDKRLGTIRYGISTTSMKEAIDQSKHEFYKEIFKLTVIIILIGILLFTYELRAARRQADEMTRPLAELTKAANTISSGNYNVPVNAATNDEIGVLANSIDTMRTTIKQYTDNLEQMVEERTQQLNASLKEQLLQANKLVTLGTLVAGVAHEINNPNNSILLTSSTLEEMWKDITPVLNAYIREHGDFRIGGYSSQELLEEMPQIYSRIINNSRRIKHIVEDLKNYSRKDSGEMAEEIDVNAIIADSIGVIDNEIKKYTSNFSVDYGSNIPRIRGMHRRLEQVFVNLIQNACQALKSTDDLVTVKTTYDEEAKKVLICITDQGVGMTQETVANLFKSFYTTKQKSGGTGLGLAVSLRIVKDHNGTLDIKSAPGQGTTARVTLPA